MAPQGWISSDRQYSFLEITKTEFPHIGFGASPKLDVWGSAGFLGTHKTSVLAITRTGKMDLYASPKLDLRGSPKLDF